MTKIKLTTTRLFVAVASMIFTLAAFTITIRAESVTKIENNLFSISDSPKSPILSPEPTRLSFVSVNFVHNISVNFVHNIEELYSAVNNPNNAGSQIFIAPGVYMLSVNGPGGVPRPNGGRLELQQNMSLQGVHGNREAVVIDAMNLSTGSGAIATGRGSNSIEWLTVRNTVNGTANINTGLIFPGTAYIRIAHIISTGSRRGIDVLNSGAAAAGRVIVVEIVDNDLSNNTFAIAEGMRIANFSGANGASISASLSGNRSYGNQNGLLVINNRSNNASISVVSSGDRFYENGSGAIVTGGLSLTSTPANGNTINFTARGSNFENNNGFTAFDQGGLVILGGENTSIPNGTSNNTVNVDLQNCRFGNNQLYDIGAFGARSNPVSVELPGTNNRVTITLDNIQPFHTLNLVTTDSVPEYPTGMNSVTVIGTFGLFNKEQ